MHPTPQGKKKILQKPKVKVHFTLVEAAIPSTQDF